MTTDQIHITNGGSGLHAQPDTDDDFAEYGPEWAHTLRVAVRWLGVAAAAVGITALIVFAFRYHIDSERQVKLACIEHGGSWVGGQCIQAPR